MDFNVGFMKFMKQSWLQCGAPYINPASTPLFVCAVIEHRVCIEKEKGVLQQKACTNRRREKRMLTECLFKEKEEKVMFTE